MAARKAGALALTIVAVCCRVLAWALCALTVLLCFSGVSTKLRLVNLVVDLTQALPALIAGYGLVPTPIGRGLPPRLRARGRRPVRCRLHLRPRGALDQIGERP